MRYDPLIRSAVLALVTYALGLIPFYFLTPIHDSVAGLWSPATPVPVVVTVIVAQPTPVKTPTVSAKAQVGADTVSVAGPTSVVSQPADPLPAEAPRDSRYAFLLLGYGGAGHDGAYLSDSIIVVIVDPDQKTLSLLSLPRDTWVPLMFDDSSVVYNKMNTAYAFARDPSLYPDRLSKYVGDQGAGVFAADTVSRLIGVPVRYFMGIDFSGFRQMIDTVGGIDVDVTESLSARYPANDDPSVDPSWTVVRFVKGKQHMNGERAIEYARARETLDNIDEGTDFARSRRQRLILESFKSRVFQTGGMIHLPQLLGIGASHIQTNYSIPDVANLSKLALDWKGVTIFQTAISTDNFLEEATGPDGTYALVPNSATHSWAQIRAFVNRLWKDPPAAVALSQSRIVVENDTGVAGAATEVTTALQDLGYVVLPPTSGSFRSESRLVDGTEQHLGSVLAPLLQADLGLSNLVLDSTETTDAGTVLLLLGANDLGVTKLSVPVDSGAPSSTVGIDKFGVWAPDLGPTDIPTETPSPVGTRKGTPTRIASAVSGTPFTGTPTVSGTPATGTPTAVGGTITTTPSASLGAPTVSPTTVQSTSLTPTASAPTATVLVPTVAPLSPTKPAASATPTPRRVATPTPRPTGTRAPQV